MNTVPPVAARLNAMQVRYRSVLPVSEAKLMMRPHSSPMSTAPRRPTHTPPICAKMTAPRAEQSIIPSIPMLNMPALLLIAAARAAKTSGVARRTAVAQNSIQLIFIIAVRMAF